MFLFPSQPVLRLGIGAPVWLVPYYRNPGDNRSGADLAHDGLLVKNSGGSLVRFDNAPGPQHYPIPAVVGRLWQDGEFHHQSQSYYYELRPDPDRAPSSSWLESNGFYMRYSIAAGRWYSSWFVAPDELFAI